MVETTSATAGLTAGPPAGLTAPLAQLRAVPLAELVREAALLERVDRKYLLTPDAAARALRSLDPATRVLEIAGQRSFAYDSVYFDTEDFAVYRLTAQRRRRRFKLRTRSYLDTGGCFLEVKTKSGRGTTVKTRVPWDTEDRAWLGPDGHEFAASVLAEAGADPALIGRLEPTVSSTYRRTTLLLPGGSRATIDTELRWRTPAGAEASAPGHIIIETKSAQRRSQLDEALWRSGNRPSGISKFGIGTAALHPGLPRNKWARALTAAVTTAPTTPISPTTPTAHTTHHPSLWSTP